MKRVLFIVQSYTRLGGVEKVTRWLLTFLSSRFETGVVTAEKEEPLPQVSLSYYSLPHADDFNAMDNLDCLEDIIRRNNYDVIVDQGCISFVYRRFRMDEPFRFVSVLHGCPKWLYVSAHRPPKPSKKDGWKGLCRYLAASHVPFYSRMRTDQLMKERLRHSASFVVLDDDYRQQLEKKFRSNVHEGQLQVIPNMLAHNTTRSRREKVVLYAGRYTHADKRLDRLLRIWKMVEEGHPQWTLHLVGDGPEKERLMAMSRRLGLQRIEFLPASRDGSLYSRASILCMTSSYEGMSLSVMEAQQAGVVPVAFGINGGMRTLIGDNEYGLLVRPFREKVYAETLGRLMDDTLRRERIADDAMRQSRFHSEERIGQMWVELIENI